jgi:ribosome recycling factor
VEHYESEADMTPNADDLAKERNKDPEKIQGVADSYLERLTESKEDLNQEIESKERDGDIDTEEADVLKDEVNTVFNTGSSNIKEASNIAI